MTQVAIIGAGVIGLSVALAAQARGLTVTVIDREGPAAGASAGNAGAFAFTDILPLASPGMMRKAPGWLLDPLGPLTIPPAYALRIAPWLWRFARACRPAAVAASTKAQTALMDLSKAELEPFLAAQGLTAMLHKRGNLQVYEGEAEFRAALPGWDARAAHGIDFQHMDADQMAALQPGLSPRFTHGTFTPGWYSIADPRSYVLALVDRFRARGGTILRAEVRAVTPGGGVVMETSRTFDQVVIAAGAYSHRLAATLGEKIPLETERGYNTTLPEEALDLRCQVTFGGHGFVISRLSTGIRVGGAVELGGLDMPPNYRRSEAMLRKAKAFFPGLKTEGGRQWMGFRPSLPDSLPAIGRARVPNVVHAFGHGHLGLTQSPGTARLVVDLLTGAPSAIDLSPFSPKGSDMRHTFTCIDGHTCGNPVRLVTGGAPLLQGATMLERRADFLARFDWIRTGLMFEPRGHDMMSGAILYPPTRADCDVGVLFIETSGCLPMCGHGTIGTITMGIENGLITPRSPGRLSIDAPAGRVNIAFTMDGAHVEEVRLTNVASYLHAEGLTAHVEGLGEVVVDVAYGGNFYAVVEPQKMFRDIADHSAADLIAWSPRLRAALNAKYDFAHPLHPEIKGLSHILWTGKARGEAHARNAVFYGDKAIDRSPCGTGTSARMAQLAAKGVLKPGDDFIHESIIGSLFKGRVEQATEVAGRPAIVPSIAGWARMTGYNTIFIDDRDPFAHGFVVR